MTRLLKITNWFFNTTRGLIIILGMLGVTLGAVVVALSLALSAQTTASNAAKRATAVATEQANEAKAIAAEADARSQQAKTSAAAIDPVVCHLVYAYINPVAGTDQTNRADQVDLAWKQVGQIVGCPQGIKF